MTPPPFDYAQVSATWETLPDVRVAFVRGENGWAKQLDRHHVCLANVPLAEGLLCMDICTIRKRRRSLPLIDAVVQRSYHQKGHVRYRFPAELEEAAVPAQYRVFSRAIHAAGCLAEGMSLGLTLVQAQRGVDVPSVCRAAASQAGCTIDEVCVVEYDDLTDAEVTP
jgi:hypothetical protein